jgi:hypothetical protein
MGMSAAELQRQLEEACKFKIRANEAAVQLAPYVHSKMPTLVVQPDATTEQYVIRVPNALPDGQAWAHAVSEVKAIASETQVNGSRRNG